MSQVTDARGMFQGATSFYQDISGWTFADNANTTGMFTGADTWLAFSTRGDGLDTADGPPGAWVLTRCLENERVDNGLCAPCTAAGPTPPEMIPQPATPGARFPTVLR